MGIRELAVGRRLVQATIGVATLFVPGAIATEATAATLNVNRPCYVNARSRAAMGVLGTGFTPGDPVTISSSDGSVSANATADANGNVGLTTGAPTPFFSLPGAKTVTLTAQDFTPSGTTITAATRVTTTALGVATRPSQARLTKRVTWYFSGFRPGRYVYGHYLRRHQVARARFGRAKGPCGLLRVRARLYPGGHPRSKSYKLQIDDSKRYSKHASPRIDTRLNTFLL